MSFFVFLILLICAVGLYFVKHIAYLYNSGRLYETLKRATKKALRLSLISTAALGLICFALCNFDFVRKIGFSLFTTDTIDSLRLFLEFLFETNSFQISLQILGSTIFIFLQLSLLFSVLGSFVTKYLVYPRIFDCELVDNNLKIEKIFINDAPRATLKLFLCLGILVI